jgi:branched-chain amino acid transport system ATP-binding protein
LAEATAGNLAAPVPEQVLIVEGLTKVFGGVVALDAVSLSVAAGERRGIIGPNGAGKTTFFNLVAGVLRPDAGTIRLFGRDVTGLSIERRAWLGVGRTYQVTNLFLDLTVEENLYLAASAQRPTGLVRSWQSHLAARERACEVATWVGLQHRLRDRVDSLSHGEQRQLEVAMALATAPKLLLLDEPVAGLAPHERARMIDFLNGLDRRTTVLLVEHDMDVALGVTDRVTVFHQGRIIADGDPDSVRADARVQEVYMGEWVNHA